MKGKLFLVGAGGLLLGCVVGFMFANQLNRGDGVRTAAANTAANNLPPEHPPLNNDAISMQAMADKAAAEPENFEAQVRAAAMFYQLQQFDRAVELLEKANRLKPDDYGTIVNLGNVHFDANRFEEAERWYYAALARNADDVNVRTDLGLTFFLRQPPDYDMAINEFVRSLKKDPNHRQTLQNLTIAYARKGDAAKSKETLARLEKLDAGNSAIAGLREEIQKLEPK